MGKTAATIVLSFGAVLLLAGTAFAVTRMCPDNCRGTADDDRLVAARRPTRSTRRRNDRVLGRGGEDALKGGDGRDEVYGQEGNDLVRGGTPDRSNDGARDVLDCGDGTDTAYFVEGQDTVRECEIINPPQ